MATKKKNESAPAEKEEVFVYLGPSIRGVIQNGTIYKGKWTEIVKNLSFMITAYPDILKLIVAADKAMAVKRNIENGTGREARAYRALLKIIKEVTNV